MKKIWYIATALGLLEFWLPYDFPIMCGAHLKIGLECKSETAENINLLHH